MYIHCMGHSLNLQDTCRSIKVMSNTFDTALELSNFLNTVLKKGTAAEHKK